MRFFISVPKDSLALFMRGKAAPEVLRTHTRSLRAPSLTCIPPRRNYQPPTTTTPTSVYMGTKGLFGRRASYLGTTPPQLPGPHNSPADKLTPGRRRDGGRGGDSAVSVALESTSLPVPSQRRYPRPLIHFFASMSRRILASIKAALLISAAGEGGRERGMGGREGWGGREGGITSLPPRIPAQNYPAVTS